MVYGSSRAWAFLSIASDCTWVAPFGVFLIQFFVTYEERYFKYFFWTWRVFLYEACSRRQKVQIMFLVCWSYVAWCLNYGFSWLILFCFWWYPLLYFVKITVRSLLLMKKYQVHQVQLGVMSSVQISSGEENSPIVSSDLSENDSTVSGKKKFRFKLWLHTFGVYRSFPRVML